MTIQRHNFMWLQQEKKGHILTDIKMSILTDLYSNNLWGRKQHNLKSRKNLAYKSDLENLYLFLQTFGILQTANSFYTKRLRSNCWTWELQRINTSCSTSLFTIESFFTILILICVFLAIAMAIAMLLKYHLCIW